MNKIVIIYVVFCLFVPVTILAATPSPIKEGLWEMTTLMEMPGMDEKIPPTKMTHCYTREELRDQQALVPKQQDCKITDQKVTSSKVSYKMVCTGENPSKIEGEITYKGTTAYEGIFKTESDGIKTNMKMKARRIGDCK